MQIPEDIPGRTYRETAAAFPKRILGKITEKFLKELLNIFEFKILVSNR